MIFISQKTGDWVVAITRFAAGREWNAKPGPLSFSPLRTIRFKVNRNTTNKEEVFSLKHPDLGNGNGIEKIVAGSIILDSCYGDSY